MKYNTIIYLLTTLFTAALTLTTPAASITSPPSSIESINTHTNSEYFETISVSTQDKPILTPTFNKEFALNVIDDKDPNELMQAIIDNKPQHTEPTQTQKSAQLYQHQNSPSLILKSAGIKTF